MADRASARRQGVDLLRRRPVLDLPARRVAWLPGPGRIDAVRELLRLVDRGLLSEAEFERLHDRFSRP